uniref:Ig-like domain-containing protein n=1 Tax=Nothobranchius furzeri TaxID=105023 RepID=A0A8C6M875_NOTFU
VTACWCIEGGVKLKEKYKLFSDQFSENFAVIGGKSILVEQNQTATLPCWLSPPPQSAEDQEVHWYFGYDHYDTLVMLYRAKMFDHGSQSASYVGRVSFGLKDATSGGLKAGDVSLKLVNVTIQDAGVYTCFVSSLNAYRGSTMRGCVAAKK